jgi:hypothetical protein
MSNSSNYEDKRYLFFYQKEMDKGEGALITLDEIGSALEYAHGSITPTYIYELVEVVIPRMYEEGEVPEDFKEQKRPIKVTYV